MGIGRGQHEHDVRGRLLDQLEQRVEGVGAQHVHLVDDVDPAPQLCRRGEGAHHQVPRIFDQAVAGGVDLDHVHGATFADGDAGRASVARLAIDTPIGAVDGLGQDACHGCLAGAPGAHEQVGMGGPVGGHRVAQGGDDRVLADQLTEALGAPATVEGTVRGVVERLIGDLVGLLGWDEWLDGSGLGHRLLTVHRSTAPGRRRRRLD